MRNLRIIVCSAVSLLVLACATYIWTIGGSATAADVSTLDIAGTYEMTKRVMSNGEEIRPPAIVALYTMSHGRGNFNLFFKGKDGVLASESTISRYSLSATQYCEWIVYTTRNNLDHPGVTNELPSLTDHCSRITSKNGRIVFAPPGEGVQSTFDKNGFTAIIAGQFVDHWRKIG